MRSPRCRREALAKLAIAMAMTLSCPLGIVPTRADNDVPLSITGDPLSSALVMTRTRGVPTIVIVTSEEHPDSVRLWTEFQAGSWARSNRGLVQVVNLSNQRDPEVVRSLGVDTFPTALVYRRGPRGANQAHSIVDCDDAEALSGRLEDLGLGLSRTGGATDPALKLTSFGGEVHPSQQYTAPATPAPPQFVQTQPPPTPAVSMIPAPTFASMPIVPAMTAGVIQVPSQNLVIQQAPPQVFMAPMQAPLVSFPQMRTAAPAPASPLYAIPYVPPANLFTPAPTPVVGPVPVPTPVAPPVVNNQTVSLQSSSSRTHVHVRGPGVVGASLSRLGERLVQFGRVRIKTVHETTLEPQLPQPNGGGLTTISTTTSAPIVQAPPPVYVPVQQAPPPLTQSPPPSVPLPSPQGTAHKKLWPFH